MTNYIFALLLEVPNELEDKFNDLYDNDHLVQMMQVPGNLRCDRYRLDWSENEDMLRYLAIYEISDPELPRSDAWKQQAGKGNWATEMRSSITDRRHGIFREISSHRAEGVKPDPDAERRTIYFLQQAIPPDLEERFNLLYDTDHIPYMLQTPGALGCKRYRLEWSASGDVPDYLAIYDVGNVDLPRSPEWKAQTAKGAWPIEMRPNFTARRNGGFTRIATHFHK